MKQVWYGQRVGLTGLCGYRGQPDHAFGSRSVDIQANMPCQVMMTL